MGSAMIDKGVNDLIKAREEPFPFEFVSKALTIKVENCIASKGPD